MAALGWRGSLTVSFCPALILSPIGYEPLEDSLDGGWIIAARGMMGRYSYGPGFGMMGGYGVGGIFGFAGIVFGVVVVVSAVMLYNNPIEHSKWGLLILIFSVLSIFRSAMAGLGEMLSVSQTLASYTSGQ